MRNPKSETRNLNSLRRATIRMLQTEIKIPRTRNVLECGGPLPLFPVRWSMLMTLCLLTTGLCFPVAAQNYSIDWHTIDGGGGTSTGGVYSVSGTIGQPDAGQVMTGGNFTLQGGFWSLIAIQTPGAPTLTIVPAGSGQATISWTPDTSGFVLQETLSLSPTNWVNSVSGSTNPVTVPVPGDMKFYRLFKP